MNYLLRYTFEPHMGKDETARMMETFAAVGEGPGRTHHFVRVDGRGGTVIGETDLDGVYRNVLSYSDWVEFDMSAVLAVDGAIDHVDVSAMRQSCCDGGGDPTPRSGDQRRWQQRGHQLGLQGHVGQLSYRGRRGRVGERAMKRKFLAGVLLAVMSLTTIVSDGAEAWEWTRARPGRLGRVTYMPDVSFAPILVTSMCLTGPCQTEQLHVLSDARPRIRRARVPGRQRVITQYVLQRWNGNQWADHTVSRVYKRFYKRGQRFTRIPQFMTQVGPTAKGGPRGHWRLSLLLVWAKGNRTLGAMAVLPSDYGDQKCLHRGMQCEDHGRWLYVHNVALLCRETHPACVT